jgi:ribonuclease VapC
MSIAVLDSSAVLAVILEEPGAEVVKALTASAKFISAVNFEEVRTKLIDRGMHPLDALEAMGKMRLQVEAFTDSDAVKASDLRTATKEAGLSLGDRACLALGQRLNAVVVTADRAWKELQVQVRVELIRGVRVEIKRIALYNARTFIFSVSVNDGNLESDWDQF